MIKPKVHARFSISTLLQVCTLAVIILLGVERHRHVRQIQELTSQKERLAWESRVQYRLKSILLMAPKNDNDHQVIQMAERLARSGYLRMLSLRMGSKQEPLFSEGTEASLIDVDGNTGGLEILLLNQYEGMSLLALFDDDQIVETRAMNHSINHQITQEFLFQDINDDGIKDVCVNQVEAVRQSKYRLAVRSTGFAYVDENGVEISATDRR